MSIQWFLIGFIGILALSYSLVAVTRFWILKYHILDIPNARSSHHIPTPRGGGIAIVIITLGGWIIYASLTFSAFPLYISVYTLTALLIALISWWDDLHTISNRSRLVIHSLAAIIAISALGYWQTIELPVVGHLNLSWLGVPLTFLWLVGLTNSYNFMDGVDGIAASQAVVAGLGWVLFGWLNDQLMVSNLGLLLAASSLGFLAHNWAPARIFMGDVGSAFLGYSFAIVPLLVAPSNARLVLAGMLLLWPFLFDTIFTFFRRLHNREDIFSAHRSHLYQRLVIAGHSHRFVAGLYTFLAAIGLLFALVWTAADIEGAMIIILGLPLLCLGLWGYVITQERLSRLT